MEIPKFGIAVQSWTEGNPGNAKYIGIDLFSKKCLFFVEIGMATNHMAEFCALGHALMHSKKHREDGHNRVFSVNKTAISWIKAKSCKSGPIVEDESWEKALEYVNRIERWLSEQKSLPSVELWDRVKWGEVHLLKVSE